MPTKLSNIIVNEVSLVSKGANKKRFYLTKSDDTEESMTDKKTETASDEVKPETVAKADLDKAQADLKAAQDKAEAIEKAAKEAADQVAVEKAALEKAAKDASEKAVALEKALKDAAEAKEVAESIQKASVEFKNLPEKAEDLGPALRTIRKADAAVADRIEGLLRKVDALVAKSIDPVGSSKAADKPDSAWAEIQKRAQALVVAKSAKNIAEAVNKVLSEDPTLYAAHVAESKKA